MYSSAILSVPTSTININNHSILIKIVELYVASYRTVVGLAHYLCMSQYAAPPPQHAYFSFGMAHQVDTILKVPEALKNSSTCNIYSYLYIILCSFRTYILNVFILNSARNRTELIRSSRTSSKIIFFKDFF